MKYLYLTTLILFFFSACGTQEQTTTHEAQNKQNANSQKNVLLAELKAKETALEKARLEAKEAKKKLLEQQNIQKEKFLKNSKDKQKNDKLSKIGISIEEDKIIIDTNATKSFFQNIGKDISSKLKKITQDLEQGSIHDEDVGVKIDKTHINIDLNQTKKFLESWGEKMQGFVKEFDNIAKKIDTEIEKIDNTTTKGN